MSDDAWVSAREAVATARNECLAQLGTLYGHPIEATPPDVLAAVNTLLRAGFDLGAEYTRRSFIPPAPTDSEVLSAAETLIRALRRG